jgi:XRE family transcriptional regulator, regulator of sulfur utilization
MTKLLKQQAVGEHVRQLRERAGLSLRALAARGDFSPSFMSQLERGLVSPSISSMERIATALGSTLGEFFAGVADGEGGLVLRASDRQRIPSSWSHAEIESLTRSSRAGMLEALRIRLEPGGRSGKHPVGRRGGESAYVLQGHPTLALGPERHRLGPGDAVSILNQELRLWVNESPRPAAILVVSAR